MIAKNPLKLHFSNFGLKSSSLSPLIIVHGLFGNLVNWRTVGRTFGENRDIYTLDLRNHGSSPHHDDMMLEHMADDLIGFINDHDIKKPSLIGHSLGGKVCMTAALKLAVHKKEDMIDSLVIADMAPVTYNNLRSFYTYIDAMAKVKTETLKSKKDAQLVLEEVEKDPAILHFLLSNLVKVNGQFQWRVNLEAIRQHIQEIGKFPFTPIYENVDKVDCPHIIDAPGNRAVFHKETLFLYSSKAGYLRPDHHQDIINAYFPNSKLQAMDCGHWLHAEKPKEFIHHVNEFLENVHNNNTKKI